MGGTSVVGDLRWTGAFGANLDLIAKTHCSVELIKLEDIKVYPVSIESTFVQMYITNAWSTLETGDYGEI